MSTTNAGPVGALWAGAIRERSLMLPLPVLLFLVAAVLRVLSFAIFYFGSVLAGQHGIVNVFDSVAIDKWAWYAAEHFRAGQWVDLRQNELAGTWDIGFTYLVAFEYTVVGHHPEVARILDCLLASFQAPAAYLAARRTVLGPKVAARAGWLVACWPLSLYWSGFDLLKDPLVWFLLAIALLALTESGWRRRPALGALAAGSVHVVRNYMGPGVAVALIISSVLKKDWKALIATIGALAAIEAVLLAAHFPPAWSPGPYLTNQELVTETQPASLNNPGEQASTSEVFTPAGLATRFTIGTLTVTFGPGLRPLTDLAHPTLDWGMYPGLLVWIALLPFGILGLWRGFRLRDPALWSVGLFAIGIWAGLALIYAGHALRQREMAFPATLIFVASGLERPWPRRWWWFYGGYWVIVVAVLSVGAAIG